MQRPQPGAQNHITTGELARVSRREKDLPDRVTPNTSPFADAGASLSIPADDAVVFGLADDEPPHAETPNRAIQATTRRVASRSRAITVETT